MMNDKSATKPSRMDTCRWGLFFGVFAFFLYQTHETFTSRAILIDSPSDMQALHLLGYTMVLHGQQNPITGHEADNTKGGIH